MKKSILFVYIICFMVFAAVDAKPDCEFELVSKMSDGRSSACSGIAKRKWYTLVVSKKDERFGYFDIRAGHTLKTCLAFAIQKNANAFNFREKSGECIIKNCEFGDIAFWKYLGAWEVYACKDAKLKMVSVD